MPSKNFHLKATGPLFLNGADPQNPEWRASSVRGQVRYWLRALLGMVLSDSQAIWQAESAIMGSTEHGSTITFRCPPPAEQVIDKVPLLPHKDELHQGLRKALLTTYFDLDLVTRPGYALDHLLLHALALWLSLGGIGKRSRRIYGGLQPHTMAADDVIDWHQWEQLRGPEDLAQLIKKQLEQAQYAVTHRYHPMTETNRLPPFPTLHPAHSRVIVCTYGWDGEDHILVAEDANVSLLQFMHEFQRPEAPPQAPPHSDDFAHDPILGFVTKKERRASPLIVQLRAAGERYYPVFTVLRSPVYQREREVRHWERLDAFLDAIKESWSGIEVWGSRWGGQHA